MKVTCSDCGNSWEIAAGDMPEGGAEFDTVCPSCGSSVAVVPGPGDQTEKSQVQWFVAFGRDRKGPFDEQAVLKMITAGEVGAGTFVWRQGFESWKKASDVSEFAPGFGSSPADAGMVWQRRESSVLFSLDDYKQRKATRSQGAVKDADVVDVRRIEDEPVSTPPQQGGGLITFDENEVQRVADALARKKKTKRGIAGLSIAVIIVVVIGAGAFVAWQLVRNSNLLKAPAPAAEVQEQQAQQPQQPAQQVQQEPVAVKQAPDAAVTPDVVPEQKAASAEPAKKTDVTSKKTAVETKPAVEKAGADTTDTAAVTPTKTAPAKEKKDDGIGAGNDADSLLAQLSAGKGKDSAKKDDSGSAGAASGLPERLAVSQVMKGFNARKGAMEECVGSSGEAVPFSAKANVEIEGSGRVVSVKLSGGGAARGCLEGVLRSVTFDRFSGPNMKVPYTISVR